MTAAPKPSMTSATRRESAAVPNPLHAPLTGWGRYPLSESDIYRPDKIAELQAVVTANTASLIPRGAGRAYGDAALNDQNRVVDLHASQPHALLRRRHRAPAHARPASRSPS